MNNEQASWQRRLAAAIARGAVRTWPDETRYWGAALERELEEVEGSAASVRWAVGGVMLFSRAWIDHVLRSWKRPAGVPETGPLATLAESARRVPRTPRFVTMLLLLASLAILMIPDARHAISATFDVWSDTWNERWVETKPSTLSHLREVAERNRDTQAMALLALVSDDHTERIRMAEEAVRLDPSLTWIYAEVWTQDERTSCCHRVLPGGWVEALEKWDPENAVPRLVAADQMLAQFEADWTKNGYRGWYENSAEKYLKGNAQWLAAMDFAFQAPKYESYYRNRWELYRDVSQRYGFRDTGMAREVLLLLPLNRIDDAEIYSSILLERGDEAEKAGRKQEAEELYSRPLRVSESMGAQSQISFERSAWAHIGLDAMRRLEPLLAKSGRNAEAASLQSRMDAVQAGFLPSSPEREWAWSETGWEGLAIRFLTSAVLLLFGLSVASLLAISIGRRVESRGRVLWSVGVDLFPILLLVASAGLYVAYRPVALVYEQYMSWTLPISNFRTLLYALRTPYESPDGMVQVYSYFDPYHYWMAAIVALSIVALYIVFRRTLRKAEA